MIKKINLNFLFLLFILSMTSSCINIEDGFDDDSYGTNYYLCRTSWVDYYTSQYGLECKQVLTFYKDGTGMESVTTYYPAVPVTEDYRFSWYWTSGYFTTIAIEYGPNDRIFFDQVSVQYSRMTGSLDGSRVEFQPYQ